MADRLISADALTELIKDHEKNLVYNITHSKTRGITKSRDFIRGVEDGYYRILSDIKQMPTIEAVPLEDYRSMEQTVYKLTQALAEAEPRVCATCEYGGNDYCHNRDGTSYRGSLRRYEYR